MKVILHFFLIALLSFAASLFFPWWTIAIVSFIVSLLIPLSPGKAFLSAFFSLFFFWGILSLYISVQNEHLLASKISLLILKSGNPFFLILLTGLIGGIVAGLASLGASLILPRTGTVRTPDAL